MKQQFTLVAAALLSFTLTYCSQPEREQEATVEETSHAAHAGAVEEENSLAIQEQAEPDTLKGSLKAEAHGMVGNAHLTLHYHSPAVRGRVIWGGLVAYNQVWVTGAHSATSLTTDKDITIGGKYLPAGKYALFTIPGQDEWTIIINKKWEQHLADDYSEKEDVLRFTVKPDTTDQHQERLRYHFQSETDSKGALIISWEKLRLSLPIEQA
ncbi:Protein of unknown function (DUF2911) [Pontibacter mucosus]|uniref:DUF2911 family protein n=1 Tax=Pontibacter mucosus TaxID=1649266 RepID=A0A2T5YCI6_9BACT|nr:DUF2911 domain-containing protein [Pontibacter mucosus]PTX14186.1 Protein of unknown function (DUF2911) [Pontibacter mucosus]